MTKNKKKILREKKIDIVKMQLVINALQNIAGMDNVHINTKARIVDLIERIYDEQK